MDDILRHKSLIVGVLPESFIVYEITQTSSETLPVPFNVLLQVHTPGGSGISKHRKAVIHRNTYILDL